MCMICDTMSTSSGSRDLVGGTMYRMARAHVVLVYVYVSFVLFFATILSYHAAYL